jgi:hypothetical protein
MEIPAVENGLLSFWTGGKKEKDLSQALLCINHINLKGQSLQVMTKMGCMMFLDIQSCNIDNKISFLSSL